MLSTPAPSTCSCPAATEHLNEVVHERPRRHEFKTKGQHVEGLIAALAQVLPDSLNHDGCQAISLRRDQDDANHVVSFTNGPPPALRGLPRLANRTGHDRQRREMLTEPMTITYFDEVITVTR